jgi:hypothetical protein
MRADAGENYRSFGGFARTGTVGSVRSATEKMREAFHLPDVRTRSSRVQNEGIIEYRFIY